jgi:predicted ribosome-associated RNA-binding protein Tma20
MFSRALNDLDFINDKDVKEILENMKNNYGENEKVTINIEDCALATGETGEILFMIKNSVFFEIDRDNGLIRPYYPNVILLNSKSHDTAIGQINMELLNK